MSREVLLRGSCACGRNRYIVEIPRASSRAAEIIFDNSTLSRQYPLQSRIIQFHAPFQLQPLWKCQGPSFTCTATADITHFPTGWHLASPFAAWLRVPLEWYHSTTYALYPDETHRSIRRTFTSPFTSETRRQFCGYCGTPLSAWHEQTREDADFISVTLGSLVDEDLGLLEELGLMTEPASDEETAKNVESQPQRQVAQQRPRDQFTNRGAPWFEEMVRDTRLGSMKHRKGGQTSRDGTMRIEWEVMEWNGGDEGSTGETTSGKRKLEDDTGTAGSGDVTMRNA